MNITRDIIFDLLPVYLAEEASEDTRLLIEEYLAQDSEMAQLIQKASSKLTIPEMPVVLAEDTEIKIFKRVKRNLFWRNLSLSSAILFTILWIVVIVLSYVWINDIKYLGLPVFSLASLFWIAFANIHRQLNSY